MTFVIRAKFWTDPEEWVRQYWSGYHWTLDVAHARVFKTLAAAEVHLDALVNPERDDSGLPVKKGRKQDWSARGGPDRLIRTNIEIVEIT